MLKERYLSKSPLYCRNLEVTLSIKKKLYVDSSSMLNGLGYGLYAGEDIEKNGFIGEYIGELISTLESKNRDKLYDKSSITYLFEVNDVWVIDSYEIGNKIRYANHASENDEKRNSFAACRYVNGQNRIILLALKPIKKGDEILFDYMITNEKHYHWLNQYNAKFSKKK